MSNSVISARGVGKMYRIRHRSPERYTALRDVMARRARSLFARADAKQAASTESFWALDGVSFDVARGETLGIIGRNGAGKSTLLKLLSRVSEPTTGRIELRGRAASLLEVGTGFHPELSGRENVFLNAAILGMRRAEIRRKFDEIVAFAEVEQFLDTPVKRYSSGMYVRLAFAVAAHLDPDILIVDEVLAVGDSAFQAKCLGKMNEVSRGGRTVLLVSHDMRAITALCRRAILLDAGRVECEGSAADVAAFYQMGRDDGGAQIDLTSRTDRSGSGDARVESIALRRAGVASRIAVVGEPFELSLGVRVDRYVGTAVLHLNILTSEGVAVYEFYNNDDGVNWPGTIGRYRFDIAIDRLALYPGVYTVNVWIGDRASHRVDYIVNATTFEVAQTPDSGVARPLERAYGLVVERARWTCAVEPA